MLNQIVGNSIPGIPAWIGIGKGFSHKGAFCGNHFHDEIEILFVVQGRKRFIINGESVEFGEGEGIFVNRRVPHITETVVDGTRDTLLQINVENLMLDERSRVNKYLALILSEKEPDYVVFRLGEAVTAEINDSLNRICREYESQQKAYNTYIKGELYHLVGCLMRYGVIKESGFSHMKEDMGKIKEALLYVDKNYAKQISLDEISNVVNMNPSYFCRYFKKFTGKTIMEYINFVRICKAESFLATTKDSVIEISMEVGFSSSSYFNRVFKNINGISPTEYRKIKHF